MRALSLGLLCSVAILSSLPRGGVPAWSQALACALCGLSLYLAAFGVAFPVARLHPGAFALTDRLGAHPWLAPALVVLAAALQCLPLPAALVRRLSPVAWEIRSFPPAPAQAFAPLTLDLPATLSALALPCAVACAMAAAWLLSGHRAARRALCAAPIVAALLQAGLMLLHLFEEGGLEGSFVNRNHAAALLVLGALCALGGALAPPRGSDTGPRAPRRSSRAGGEAREVGALVPLLLLAAAICASAALLTLSRGGALALLAGVLFLLLQRRSAAEPGSRARIWLRAGALVALVCALGAALLLSAGPLWERAGHTASEGLRSELKLHSFLGAGRVAADHWLLGAGRGAFRFVSDRHRSVPGELAFLYAENEPLQLAAELGIPLALAVLLLLFAAFLRGLRSGSREGLARGALAGALALALHNLVDFNLELLGVALPAGIAFAAAVRPDSEGRAPGEATAPDPESPRPAAWGAGRISAVLALPLALLCAAAAVRAEPLQAERAAAELVQAGQDPAVSADEVLGRARSLLVDHPADWLISLEPAAALLRRSPPRTRDALAWAGRAQLLAPLAWRPHAVAAAVLLRAGARGQARVETRLALANSGESVPGPPVLLALQASSTLEELLLATPEDAIVREALVGALRTHGRAGEARALASAELARLDAQGARPEASAALAAPGQPAIRERLLLQLALLALGAGDGVQAEALAFALPRSCEARLLQSRARALLGKSAAETEAPLLEGLTRCADARPLAEALVQGRLARGEAAAALQALEQARGPAQAQGWAADWHLYSAAALEAQGHFSRGLGERYLAAELASDRAELALDYAARLVASGDRSGALSSLRTLSSRASGEAHARLEARLAELERR